MKEKKVHYGRKGEFTACGIWWQRVPTVKIWPLKVTCGNCRRTKIYEEYLKCLPNN